MRGRHYNCGPEGEMHFVVFGFRQRSLRARVLGEESLSPSRVWSCAQVCTWGPCKCGLHPWTGQVCTVLTAPRPTLAPGALGDVHTERSKAPSPPVGMCLQVRLKTSEASGMPSAQLSAQDGVCFSVVPFGSQTAPASHGGKRPFAKTRLANADHGGTNSTKRKYYKTCFCQFAWAPGVRPEDGYFR